MPLLLQSTAAKSNQLILIFSEDIQIAGGGTINPAYMSIIVDGEIRGISTTSEVTGSELTLSMRSLDRASTLSISNNPPIDGSNQGYITDLKGNPLASITLIVDTFSTDTSISKKGIASAYKNLNLTGFGPLNGYGNYHNNTIRGNDASNIIDGLAGADTMIGGLGNDTYFVDHAGDAIIEVKEQGTDIVQSSITYALADNLENLTLLGSGAINGTGNASNNILTGNTGDNVLNGNDGTDTLIGGRGNDTYLVNSTDDIIIEAGYTYTSEIDSVQSSISWVLGTNLENLILTETSSINGTGNERNNTIIGNSANNILDGSGGGTDRLTGLGGADTFKFSTRPSSFRNSSADHITDFNSTQGDKIQISKSAFGISTSTATLSVVSTSNQLSYALTSAAMFIYDPKSGELHWNQNGMSRFAGSGGVLAILDNRASLSGVDLVLV